MAEEFKNVLEHETPKVATDEPSATTGEVKDRGLFDFLGKKEEVKPQGKPLVSEFEHKTEISEPPAFVAKHEEEEEKENKPSLLEKLHQKHEKEEEDKPSLLQKLHRSNSSSSSSSDEEGEDGEKKKKKVVEGEEKTEEEKNGVMEKIKEKLPGHGKKPEDDVPVVTTAPIVATQHPMEHPVEHSEEHPAEKNGILEKIKEKLPGYNAKTSEEEEKKENKSG